MVVTGVPAQTQRLSGDLTGLGEDLRPELLREKSVGLPLIDQDLAERRGPGAATGLDQRTGVVVRPRAPVLAEVVTQGLLSPGDAARGDDRRES